MLWKYVHIANLTVAWLGHLEPHIWSNLLELNISKENLKVTLKVTLKAI